MATTQEAYQVLEQRFIKQNPKSKALYEAATEVLPGGNTRTVLFYDPFPVYITHAKGHKLYDADGHEYIDLLGEYTAGLYGHSEPVILKAINDAAQKGLSFGSHHEDEIKLATLVQRRFPSMERIRFTNSGTESTLMALAAAKVYTGKSRILVFSGAYHGGAFSFKDGVSSAVNAPHEYLIATYNDIDSVKKLVDANASDLAAILLEPMLGSGGAIPADAGFLHQLKSMASDVGAVLIFDEVMTSRMHSGGGIQSEISSDCRPHMTTLGKYIGGGMSFGAFGGRREIMELFDPRKPGGLAHAGTFNNNVLTMAAGRAGLEQVFTPQRAQELHQAGEQLRNKLNHLARGTLLTVTGSGSIMCFHFTKTDAEHIKSPGDVADADVKLNNLFHLFLLQEGFYVARRGFLSLSLAVPEASLDDFVYVVQKFVEHYRQILQLRAMVDETPAQARL